MIQKRDEACTTTESSGVLLLFVGIAIFPQEPPA